MPAEGSAEPAPPRPAGAVRLARRRAADRLARLFVTSGGIIVILAILAILVVIVWEIMPLFRSASATAKETVPGSPGAVPLAVVVDEYQEAASVVTARGFHFLSLTGGAPPAAAPALPLDGASVESVSLREGRSFALGLSDGRVFSGEIRFDVLFSAGKRKVTASVKGVVPMTLDPGKHRVRQIAHAVTDGGFSIAGRIGSKELAILAVRKKKALAGPGKSKEWRRTLSLPIQGEISALVMDERGDSIFAGTSAGEVARVNLREPDAAQSVSVVVVSAGSGVTALGFLIGGRTLAVGDSSGGVGAWQLTAGGALEKIHAFEPHSGPVTIFSASQRDKGFLTGDEGGTLKLHYGTTGRTLLSLAAPGSRFPSALLTPKANGIVAIDAAGRIFSWILDNPHPEATIESLFGKVWYEGYDKPEYVWQSTGGTDDFESKFSLRPLIYGTLKGTFYALVFAVPLALLSALYVSQFMHARIRGHVKPVVEIMAALPSVVLGFVAGVLLAPAVERIVPGIFLMPPVVGGLILAAVVGWRTLPTAFRKRMKPGTEIALLVPLVLGGLWLSAGAGSLVEAWLLGGDYRGWLLKTFDLKYDQRNSLVVGFAMGFAVIPIIFTIAEDAFSNVPQHLWAGSLALGATPWQTATRVILPTASPGLFSAVMIGLGRAVGETMIVLMATGNTPVMDFSMFNGFRALSANIAVELPEAPAGTTHFRVLFLAALLLFVLTFVVNTAAEMVRLRLRKRYQCL